MSKLLTWVVMVTVWIVTIPLWLTAAIWARIKRQDIKFDR